LAVYPAHGVGKIESVEPKNLAGVNVSCYVMRLLDNNLTIFIPTGQARNVGLRAVIGREEADKIWTILGQNTRPSTAQTWNRRYRGYMDKIKTGSAYEVAEVFRDLNRIKADRELSFGERKVLDVAQGLLIRELSIAQETEESQVVQQIKLLFN
jgi:CarD family transcriptional regulator